MLQDITPLQPGTTTHGITSLNTRVSTDPFEFRPSLKCTSSNDIGSIDGLQPRPALLDDGPHTNTLSTHVVGYSPWSTSTLLTMPNEILCTVSIAYCLLYFR